jgi:quinol monooxygenase YgiN
MRGKRLFWVLLCVVFLQANLASGQQASAQVSNKEYQAFAELLKHYQKHPQIIKLLEKEDQALLEDFKKHDLATLKKLPPNIFKNLYQRFYAKFYGFEETFNTLQSQLKSLKDRKISTPLGDKKTILELDLKIGASEDQLKQARFVLFSTSFEANKALLSSLKSPSVKAIAQKEEADKQAALKQESLEQISSKMPGNYQGSKEERMSTSEADKLNLTPVDPEFYNTQLGKKLEKDLGGRANYWSYDFDQDELYVVVGSDVGKLRVRQRDQSTRIIQTRTGGGFQDFPNNYQGDEAVDLNVAEGRFLTGDVADPTLFGAFPTIKDDSIPESKIPHNHGAGHGHDHKH